jgi:hypothetical protein
MTKKELVVSIAGILLLAILSEVMWLYEISVKIGWASLLWLKEDLFSPIGICFCAGTAYILPFLVKHKQIDGKVILTWLSFIFLNITVFYFGEAVLKNLFSPIIAYLSLLANIKMRLFGLFAVGLFGYGYHIITKILIMKVRKQQTALFLISVFLMFVLGMGTALFVPGFGQGFTLTDAVKMGYPQFWICILLGLSGILTIKYFSEEND